MLRYNLDEVKNALLESVLDRYNDVPQENEIDYTFSKKFEAWVQKLIKKMKNPKDEYHYHFNSRKLKMVLIAVALIAALAVTAMAVPAIREAILDFFLSDREESYGITFDPEQAASAPRGVQEYRTPQYVPDGFELIVEDKSVAAVVLIWTNDKDELITYNQIALRQDATKDNWIGLNAEGVERSSAIICGYKVEILQDVDMYTAIWTDNEYLYYMEISNSVTLETFSQILNSITAVQ